MINSRFLLFCCDHKVVRVATIPRQRNLHLHSLYSSMVFG